MTQICQRTKPALVLMVAVMVVSCSHQAVMTRSIGSTKDSGTGNVGVMVMAHGGSEEWNAAVREAVLPLRTVWPVAIAFGMADPSSLQTAVDELEEQQVDRIVVVRMFLSGKSFLHQTEYLLGFRPDPPETFTRHGTAMENMSSNVYSLNGHHPPPSPIQSRAQIELIQEGLLDSPVCGTILAERLSALSRVPEEESVLILAHGPGDDEDNDLWLERMDRFAAEARNLGSFHRVRVETLREDWPEKRRPAEERIRSFAEQEQAEGKRLIVIPFRVYGFGPYADVLHDLVYLSDGRGLLPHDLITEWLNSQILKTIEPAG
ncbi:MAG: hypothetical protein V3U24_07800 [Candidatus Neomarinimicrobiota bacterium]